MAMRILGEIGKKKKRADVEGRFVKPKSNNCFLFLIKVFFNFHINIHKYTITS